MNKQAGSPPSPYLYFRDVKPEDVGLVEPGVVERAENAANVAVVSPKPGRRGDGLRPRDPRGARARFTKCTRSFVGC